MARNQIIGRLEKLEQRQPAQTYNGVNRFIWHGPKDDEALAVAESEAETCGKLLILRRLITPSRSVSQETIIRDGVVIMDDCGRAPCIP